MSTTNFQIEKIDKCADPESGSTEMDNVANLLTLLSRKDSLAMLAAAKKGMSSDLKNPERLGLTKKRYYTRLKQLKDRKLVKKVDGVYIQTTLGSLIYENCIAFLQNLLKEEKMMQMIDALKSTKKYTDQEISQFAGHMNINSQACNDLKISPIMEKP